MMTTIYINGRFLSQNLTGVQRYAREIVKNIDTLLKAGIISGDYVLLMPAHSVDIDLNCIRTRKIGSWSGHFWDQFTFYRKSRNGVAINLASTGPLLHRRSIVVLHDAAVYRHPEFYSTVYRTVHQFIGRFISKRSKIVTVSRFSQRELASVLGLAQADISIVSNGHEHLLSNTDELIFEKLGIKGNNFFVTLSSLTVNKNLSVVFKAIERLPRDTTKIVVIGAKNTKVFSNNGQSSIPSDIIMTGRLEDAEIAGLLSRARALIFPSLYEGFGIPPLEAMANGCPVIASTAEAIVETCGEAAVYFNPHDDKSLSDLILTATQNDGNWRDELSSKARKRVKLFTWRESAITMHNLCKEILER